MESASTSRERKKEAAPRKAADSAGLLAGLPLFRNLDRGLIARIAKGATEVVLPRGAVLFRRGAPADGFYVVISGLIKLALQVPGKHEKVVELVAPGQSFGEAAMFLERPHLVWAVALTDSRVLRIPRQIMLDEMGHNPRLAQRMIASLSRRLHQFIDELEAVSLRTGTERVIGFLIKQLPETRRGNACTTTLPASKGIIASQLNLTQEHFSRILHDLTAAGLIKVKGRTIQIPDVKKLAAHES